MTLFTMKMIMDYLVQQKQKGNLQCEWKVTDKSLIMKDNNGKRIIKSLHEIYTENVNAQLNK